MRRCSRLVGSKTCMVWFPVTTAARVGVASCVSAGALAGFWIHRALQQQHFQYCRQDIIHVVLYGNSAMCTQGALVLQFVESMYHRAVIVAGTYLLAMLGKAKARARSGGSHKGGWRRGGTCSSSITTSEAVGGGDEGDEEEHVPLPPRRAALQPPPPWHGADKSGSSAYEGDAYDGDDDDGDDDDGDDDANGCADAPTPAPTPSQRRHRGGAPPRWVTRIHDGWT